VEYIVYYIAILLNYQSFKLFKIAQNRLWPDRNLLRVLVKNFREIIDIFEQQLTSRIILGAESKTLSKTKNDSATDFAYFEFKNISVLQRSAACSRSALFSRIVLILDHQCLNNSQVVNLKKRPGWGLQSRPSCTPL
jgi:hypothetical protein